MHGKEVAIAPAMRNALGIAVRHAIATCAEHSRDGLALVVNDMRAFLNPTRVRTIERLAGKLAARVLSTCPRCAAPGFGHADVAHQFTCEMCGTPTIVPSHNIHKCAYCNFTEFIERPKTIGSSSPNNCLKCNP
jgi:hypothetical protein